MHQSSSNPTPIIPNFQSDQAASDDFFGSHNRVASAVCDVILHSRKSNIIGLLGSWGSGKSTITKIVDRRLTTSVDNDGFCFFYFDAWLHQSDGPRRAFLESFVDFLERRGLAEKANWKDDLDRLSRRRDDTEVTTTPTLSLPGKWIALSLFPAAIGWKFADKENSKIWWTDSSLSSLGYFLIFLPVIAGCLAWYWMRRVRKPWHWSNFWTWENFTKNRTNNDETVFSIFVNKSVQNIKTRTMRTPEPTAIEFKEVFTKILATVAKPDRSFVFVIDNLDRVSDAEAITIWATIRSFFIDEQVSEDVQPNSDSKITVLLPLDLSAIERMFNKNDGDRLATSFIDKTFDLVFHVNPPTQSGWQEYFSNRLKSTLSEISEGDVFACTHFYQKFIQSEEFGVTPRSINALVDRISILFLQWRKTIPLATIAFYAANIDKYKGRVIDLLKINDQFLQRIDNESEMNLAALHFGVEPKDALQVILEPKISRAIREKDADALREYSDIKGFDSVLLNAVEVIRNRNDVDTVEDGLTVSSFLPGLGLSNSDRLAEMFNILRGIVSSAEISIQPNDLTSTAISNLLKYNASIQSSEVGKFILVALEKTDVRSNERVLATHWVATVNALIDSLPPDWSQNRIIRVPGSARFFSYVLDDAAVGSKASKMLFPSQPINQIGDVLTERAIEEKFSIEAFDRIRKIQNGQQIDLSKYVDAAVEFIENGSHSDPGYVYALRSLGVISKRTNSKTVKVKLENLSKGHLLDRYYASAKGDRLQSQAASLAPILIYNPAFSLENNVGNAQAGVEMLANLDHVVAREDLITELDERLSEGSYLKDLLDAAETNKQVGKIFRQVVRLRLEAGFGSLHIGDAISRFSTYAKHMAPGQAGRFADELVSYGAFWSEIEAKSKSADASQLLKSLVANQTDGPKARSLLRKWVTDYDEAAWINHLAGKGIHGSALWSGWSVAAEDFVFGEPLERALEAFILENLQKEDAAAQMENAFGASRYLEHTRREILFKKIRDVMLSGSTPAGMWDAIAAGQSEANFIEEGKFEERSDDSIRHIIFPMLKDIKRFLPWLEANSATINRWREGADSTSRRYARETLSDMRDDKEMESAANLAAAAIGIRLARKTKKASDRKSESDESDT